MGWFRRANDRRQREFRADISLVSQWINEAMAARAGTGSAVPYDELPITQGAGQLISDTLAAMVPYPVDERTGARLFDEFDVLRQPNPNEDRAETIVKIAQAMYWTGNANTINAPRDDRGAVPAVTVVNPNSVSGQVDPLDELRVSEWFVNDRPHPVTAVTHFKMNDDPRRGPLGESPLRRCATALDTYGWAYRFLGDYFASGGPPSQILKSKIELGTTKILELSEEWTSARRQGRPAFVPPFLDLQIPPTTGELDAVTRVLGFATADVARALNLPTSLVNAPVAGYSLTYNNVADEVRRWLVLSLGTTWVARLERGMSQWLPPGIVVRLDPTPVFRADLAPDSAETPPPAPSLGTQPLEVTQ